MAPQAADSLTSQALTTSFQNAVFLARQPIFDASGRVHAYELLYRDASTEASCDTPGDVATARVLHGAVMSLGLETLTPGCPAFVNVGRQFLVSGMGELLPPESVVFELLETIDVDDAVVAACRMLRGRGYALALDDFVPGSGAERLLPLARYVKVDVLALDAEARRQLVSRLPPHLHLLAEKVETAEMRAAVAEEGFTLFQGYYFCRPSTVRATDISTRQITALKLLEALNRPGIGLVELDELIKQDAALCSRALRYVNSAALGLSRRIHSMHQALTLIGLDPIRKWVSVWTLAGLSQSRPAEVMTMAVVRGRCCEALGQSLYGEGHGGEFFLLGLCSLLEVLLERPMTDVLQAIALPERIAAGLLNHPGPPRSLLDAVIAYERGQWDAAGTACTALGIPPGTLALAYTSALTWARSLDA